MWILISYIALFFTSTILLQLVDRDPTHVTALEYLMLAIMVYCAVIIFRKLLDLYQQLNP